MRPLRGSVWACALLVLASEAVPAQASWCNVMQVCWHKNRRTANYCAPQVVVAQASPCDSCAPQPAPCTTSYVQRCYYQPVTSYATKTYYEPVTTYQTSYYYEPVTSYRYSCYYDACSCSYQQVACPTTSYQLKSRTCAVQSWAQKCAQVPVTTYQQSFYWEPVTTCSNPCSPCGPTAQAAPQQAAAAQGYIAPQSGVYDGRGAGVSEYPNQKSLSESNRFPAETMPPATNSSYRWQPSGVGGNKPVSKPAPAQVPVKLRMDRIA